ncbi:MAG: Pr6Pr family membrane protein [Candidatus Izemoplasma sp.]|nr:Pr6Pr family membrane protein [Candidatus Izemoplasma sp.]
MKTKMAYLIVLTSSIGLLTNMIVSLLSESPIISFLSLFKYFTIWSNVFVLLLFLGKALNWHWIDRLKGGIYINITITMVVYITLLSWTYTPEGLYILSNIMNHYVTPLLAIGYFIQYENKNFMIEHIALWMIFPIYYLGFALNYSALTNNPIYPFFDFINAGLLRVSLFVIAIFIIYLILSMGIVKIFSQK